MSLGPASTGLRDSPSVPDHLRPFGLSLCGCAAGLLAACLAGDALGATLNVPADHATVRAAVAAAVGGDTILIAPGRHSGGAWINGKALTIASWYAVNGDTARIRQTVLDGVASDVCGGAPGCAGNAVLEFGDNAHGSAVVGLTIANGENGIASASVLDLARSRVIGNGDGVDYVVGAGGSIRNCLFADNTDDGIDLNGRMKLAILDNDIRDNRDDGIEFRLYAYAGGPQDVDIIGNRITGNGEDGIQFIDYPGPGLYVLRIERNFFQSNFDASGLSGAITVMPNGETIESLVGSPMTKRMRVIHNTFVGEKNGVVGGANALVLNNVFTGIQGAALRRVGGSSIAAHSLFWNNGANQVESVVDPALQIEAAPLLDANGIPAPTSPAIDAGAAFFQWQGETILDVPAAGYAGRAPDLGAFETDYNLAPRVSAGPDRLVILSADVFEVLQSDLLTLAIRPTLTGSTTLAGVVTDDGLPYPPSLRTSWSVVSGPGPVRFSDPTVAGPRATFFVPGTYFLRVAADDGQLNAWDLVKVTVRAPINSIPTIDAGPPQTVHLRDPAVLEGTVSDDGLPEPPGAVVVEWSQVSGPGPVSFETPTLPATRATFPSLGSYVLRLWVSDGEFDATDTMTVTVIPVRNRAPVVSAGTDQTVMIPSVVLLDGTVTDDGLPDPPAAVTTLWSVVSGPGSVAFGDPGRTDTAAGFTVAGVYRLRLSASDGLATAADTIEVTILPPPPPLERRIAMWSDDAEERSDGHIVRKTAGLDLVDDSGSQTVGLRFTAVAIPSGATIIGAWIQFKADAVRSEATDLVFQGQAADNPATFTLADHDVSSRPRTTASANWSPPAWTVVGEAGPAQRTSDLKAVIQELVDRPGWASGNAMAFIVTGTGQRTARTFEADAAGAALLHIEYGGLAQPMGAAPATATVAGGAGAATGPVAGADSPLDPDRAIGREPAPRPPLELAIVGLSPQPSRGALRVEFTLAGDEPASLELVDITGRRVDSRRLAMSGAGRHAIELRQRLPAGVYLVRLTQGARTVMRKAVVLE